MKILNILLVGIGTGLTSHAQIILRNDNSILSLTDDVTITVEGGLSNHGTILNEGAMRLYGDWTNDGDYSSVSGTLSILSLSTLNNGSSEIGNLIVDAPKGVLVTKDLVITQSLTLSNGQVILSDHASISMGSAAILNGGSQSSYINGTLFLPPSSSMTFPIGTDTEYLPVLLEKVNGDTLVGVRAYSNELDIALSREIEAVSPNRHWQIFDDDTFIAESIQLPLISESFIENQDDAIIGHTSNLDEPINVLGQAEIIGTLQSGTMVTSGSILPGYYTVANSALVGPPITVINVVTTLQDGKHDFLRIENIEFYENNLVEIYDRTGVKIFEMNGYDNQNKVFRGIANVGSRDELATGSYYYTVQLTGNRRESGFIYVKSK